ncbi:caldesmon isoform X1 [Gracilaria domingensis]|nr:caldesmon isoform X1 [Gracilaria domingensis]
MSPPDPAQVPARASTDEEKTSMSPSPEQTRLEPHETAARPSSQAKNRRFRFTDTYDLFLLRAVRKEDAHVAKWGHTETAFDKVLQTFLSQVPSPVFLYTKKPSTKTLVDRFKRLIALRRSAVKQNESASGIAEVFGEKEELLDDLILEMDEKAEQLREEKEQQNKKERRLIEAGEIIRMSALKRASRGNSSGSETHNKANERQKRVRHDTSSGDAISQYLEKQANMKNRVDTERLQIERDRMEAEENKLDTERQKLITLQAESVKRLELAEKRLEIERSESEKRFNLEVEERNRRFELDKSDRERRFDLEKQERDRRYALEREERMVAMEERKQFMRLVEMLRKKKD